MELSPEEAATKLGKSVRQIRYMMKEGRLPARKVGGRWRVTLPAAGSASATDPATSPPKAAERKQARLRAAVEDALELDPAPRRYSLRDLKAVQLGLPLYQQALSVLGAEHGACSALRQVLEQLSRGCHRFEHADKAQAYRTARDAASQAVCELLLVPAPGSVALLDGIEQELMAALAGLLRRLDSRRPSRRDT